mmetsp:Transcript_24928/g.26020  ORF Transcript_24928/g.26020 Transcript_24928/m.26020 type:complete len:223 (+) Transcript_24928:41-709(+)|eukprot:CAMPEP_0170528666 /NCGR_PEP_ID=MMETSP0209-20121228/14172_1 /TAXON_ID=665100 ORGANISM="Litonotus pictus, Strain P1" /NCGR_SAMPLE_ID=MMETSP0209 /ASSEMBLY_ACC=CAM_ASM_000301 /LENGTH=222 /DNA_ID=CAMNT_0010820035 /DNA_START=32 /DNA_END=700 /DNA_ORIENTATION=+
MLFLSEITTFFQEQLLIDITETNFLWSLVFALQNWICWMIIPTFEYKFNILSRFLGGDKGRANDMFAYAMIHTGAIRNLYYHEAINNNTILDYGVFGLGIEILGALMAIFGFVLIFGSYYRLGMRNMYFGDYFGFTFKEMITAFPYNRFDNPQYIGTTCFFLGLSIFHHSPTGVLLTFITWGLYSLYFMLEERMLIEFYPAPTTTKNKNTVIADAKKSIKSE